MIRWAPNLGPLERILGRIGGSFESFRGSGGTIWEAGSELGHMYVKKGGGPITRSPVWARKSRPGRTPRGAQETRKSAEEGPKRRRRSYVKGKL